MPDEAIPPSGVIKTPLVFDGKTHDSCPPLPKFVDEKRKTIHRFWCDAYLKELNTTLSHVQEWFIKISSTNQMKFMRQIVQIMGNSRRLFDAAYFIGPPTKDVIYEGTTTTSNCIARCKRPKKGDRKFENRQVEFLSWFRSLSSQEQCNTIVGLAHLGGSSLQRSIYSDLFNAMEILEKDRIKRKVLEYMATKKDSQARMESVVSSKVIVARQTKKRKNQTKKINSKSKPKEPTPQAGETVVNKMSIIKDKIKSFEDELNAMTKIGEGGKVDADVKKGKTGKKSPKSGKKAKSDSTVQLDRIQLLPLWDNRRILSFMPPASFGSLSQVNKYWKGMADRTKKELRTRKKLDEVLSKIEAGT